MNNANFGVIEGFYGFAWSELGRESMIKTLSPLSSSFYLYAPKKDAYLRKNWLSLYPQNSFDKLKKLGNFCRDYQVAFGMGLTPFDLKSKFDMQPVWDKLDQLKELSLDFLGLFFDDIQSQDQMVKNQIEFIQKVYDRYQIRILVCPSYYSDDPILDKVFGDRPKNYLKDLAHQLPLDVDIMWTGPKVISPVIDSDHLKKVSDTMGRKPFVWDNTFANDGPKNCQFLKLNQFQSPHLSMDEVSGWGLNLMNQAYLSQISLLNSYDVLIKGLHTTTSFESRFIHLMGKEWFKFFIQHTAELKLAKKDWSTEVFTTWMNQVSSSPNNPYVDDLKQWLNDYYLVDQDCLTD